MKKYTKLYKLYGAKNIYNSLKCMILKNKIKIIYIIFYRLVLNKRITIWIVIAAIVVIAVTLGLIFGLKEKTEHQIVGAVVSNGKGCAEIGR